MLIATSKMKRLSTTDSVSNKPLDDLGVSRPILASPGLSNTRSGNASECGILDNSRSHAVAGSAAAAAVVAKTLSLVAYDQGVSTPLKHIPQIRYAHLYRCKTIGYIIPQMMRGRSMQISALRAFIALSVLRAICSKYFDSSQGFWE